jgi:hypothetical protein
VIGSGEVGRGVIRTLMARPDLGFRIIGYLDDGTGENNLGSGRVPHLGSYRDLRTVLQENPSTHSVFVALPGDMNRQILAALRVAHAQNVRTQVVPDLLQMSLNPLFSADPEYPRIDCRGNHCVGNQAGLGRANFLQWHAHR